MAATGETVLDVAGMSCASCVRHVQEALGGMQSVVRVDVELREGKVRVWHDAQQAPVDRLVAAVVGAGYEATARR